MSTPEALTYYAVLGVNREASIEALKAAYYQKALLLHPDKAKDPESTESFQVVQEAWRVSIKYQRPYITDMRSISIRNTICWV